MNTLPSEILEQIFAFSSSLVINFYERPKESISFQDCFGKTQNGFLVRMFPHVTLYFKDLRKKNIVLVDANQIDFLWKYAIYARVICHHKQEGLMQSILSEQLFDSLISLDISIIGYDTFDTGYNALERLLSQTLQQHRLKNSLRHIACEDVASPSEIQKLLTDFPQLSSMFLKLRFKSEELDFTQFTNFVDHPTLRTIRLQSIKSVQTVNSILKNRNLTTMEFSCDFNDLVSSMDDETLELLSTHPNMKRLKFEADDLRRDCLEAIVRCPTIKSLTLFSNNVFTKFSLHVLTPGKWNAAARLEHFETNCRLEKWDHLADNDALKSLSVSRFAKYGPTILANMREHAFYIEKLKVEGAVNRCKFTDFAQAENLRELDVTGLVGMSWGDIDDLLATHTKLNKLIVSKKTLIPRYCDFLQRRHGSRFQVAEGKILHGSALF